MTSMNNKERVAIVCLALTAVSAVGLFVEAYQSRIKHDALLHRVAQMEASQGALLESYLTGNRASREKLALSVGYKPVRQNNLDDRPSSVPSPREMERERQVLQTKFESEFAAEPINPAWAGTMANDIEDSIVNIAAGGESPPRFAKVDCRSKTCRIELGLSDTKHVAAYMDSMLVDIAKSLPNARMVESPAADGKGIDIKVFASR